MPRWARFLSCSFTGLLVVLCGLLLAVDWFAGGPNYWQGLLDFAGTSGFWYLAALFGLLVAAGLAIARAAVGVYRLHSAVAGLACGGAVALVYACFLVAAHAGAWGGWASGLHRSWPDAAVFIVPFALTGSFTAWLWDRLG